MHAPTKTLPIPSNTRRLLIKAGEVEKNYWRDLWRYRELLQVLAWRDVAVRYKQTIIGIAWAFVRPLLTMVVFTVIFGKLAKLPSDGTTPYPLMVFAGIVLVQRQLEKVRLAANEWVLLFWLRLALRVSLAWRSFWSRAAKMAASLPTSLSAGVI